VKWLRGLLDRMGPLFNERGKLRAMKPLFEAGDNFFFAPATRSVRAPHVRDPLDLKRFMSMVIIALIPCVAASVYFFGLRVLAVIVVSYAAGGGGLAAPQGGGPIRLFVYNPNTRPGEGEGVCINPRIVDPTRPVVKEEGCLSLPGVTCNVKRFTRLTLRARDVAGEALEIQAEDLLAEIFQHETDHLNGMLLIDRMSPVAKLANRRTLRELEESAREAG